MKIHALEFWYDSWKGFVRFEDGSEIKLTKYEECQKYYTQWNYEFKTTTC